MSFGLQSTAPHVLQVLDRTHTPGRAVDAVGEALAAGFEHVNVDLIYATPGETEADFAASLEAAASSGADHVSAYSLIVEDGTRLAARIRRGELPDVDDDVAADRYLQAEQALSAAGMQWYEVSNWARPGGECRHNLAYWRGDDWWGVGPGAHAHVGGVRWWNVRHPSAYAERIAAGQQPRAGARGARRPTTGAWRTCCCACACARACRWSGSPTTGARSRAARSTTGSPRRRRTTSGLLVLTLRGRLLADALVRDLVD